MAHDDRDPEADRSKPTTEFHVGRLRAGDPSAFASLYERLAPSLEAWARLRVSGGLRDYVEPGDVVQEVWWRAMDSFPRYDPDRTDFRPWIFKIATNVLLEWNRSRRRRARIDPRNRAERVKSLPPMLARQATSVGREVVHRESVAQLIEIVRQMEEIDRAIFLHCGLEGRTAAATALLVVRSEDAVEQRWRRLRQRLADHPIGRHFDPAGF
jgi:RNA polymerase sigma-70 factor, ECF subfamily